MYQIVMYWPRNTVPLVVVFTKFDGQIIQQSIDLDDVENDEDTVTQKTLSMLSALRKNDFYLIG